MCCVIHRNALYSSTIYRASLTLWTAHGMFLLLLSVSNDIELFIHTTQVIKLKEI